MSRENVEIIRRFLEHWNATRDFPWELVDPDILYVIDPPAWLAGTYRGRAEVEDMVRSTLEIYDEFRFEGDEFIDAGAAIVVLGAVHARGALSGASVVQTAAIESRVHDGRIYAFRAYLDRDAALEAAGLRE